MIRDADAKRRGMAPRGKVLLALAGLLLAGCAGQASGNIGGWYSARGGVAPSGTRIYVCHAYGCARKTPFDFSPAHMRRFKAILAKGRKSPAAERAAIAEAIAWSERTIGPIVGSDKDIGGYDLHNAGVPGQMDCIDEATNTTSVLSVLARAGYLAHHQVASPVARGFFLDGRYPHATAVVRETKGGAAFAVDSWPEANGIKPVVMPLDAWFAERS